MNERKQCGVCIFFSNLKFEKKRLPVPHCSHQKTFNTANVEKFLDHFSELAHQS